MPGYKLKIKGDYARLESLLCPYCKDILKEAIQTESGFRLCLSCYDVIQKDMSILKNPQDQLEIEKGELECTPGLCTLLSCQQIQNFFLISWYHPDKAARREVNKISVYCQNVELGCTWHGTVATHEKDHKLACEYKSENCPNGCGVRVLLEKLERHMKEECLKRKKCQHCDVILGSTNIQDHKCPVYRCESCGKIMKQTEEVLHKLEGCEATHGRDTYEKKGGRYIPTVANDSDAKTLFLHQQHLGLKFEKSKKIVMRKLDEIVADKSDMNDTQIVINKAKELQQDIQTLTKDASTISDHALQSIGMLTKEVQLLKEVNSSQVQTIQALQTRSVDYSSDRFGQLERKIAGTDRQLAVSKIKISELELQLQASLASTYNGSFLWRIPDIKRRRRDALERKITSIYTPPFYTGRNGYKMCVRACLNGDGIGYNTHLSIFFVLMKGEYDPLLKWPFDYKVSLILVDQDHRRHIVQTFKPSLTSSSFQKPTSNMNTGFGCPKFADLTQVLENESYVKDNIMFIKCIVDIDEMHHPLIEESAVHFGVEETSESGENLLEWKSESFVLLDQNLRKHNVEIFKPSSPGSNSSRKPNSDMNGASGCPQFGVPEADTSQSYTKCVYR